MEILIFLIIYFIIYFIFLLYFIFAFAVKCIILKREVEWYKVPPYWVKI